jgi:hypothetical protein
MSIQLVCDNDVCKSTRWLHHKQSCITFFTDSIHFEQFVAIVQQRKVSLHKIMKFCLETTDFAIVSAEYSRKHFDPYRRGCRVTLCRGTTHVHTTLGQLNFFRWFLQYHFKAFQRVYKMK